MRMFQYFHISVLFSLEFLLCVGEQPILSCQETLSIKLVTIPVQCHTQKRDIFCLSTSILTHQISEMRMSFTVLAEPGSLDETTDSDNVSRCIGIYNLVRTLKNEINITTIEHVVNFSLELSVGVVILDRICWELGNDNCIREVRIREDVITLPQFVVMPDSPEFWDFSSPLLRAELGWVFTLYAKGFVNRTYSYALRGLAWSSIGVLDIDGYFGLDKKGPIPALDHLPNLLAITVKNNQFIKLTSGTLNGTRNIEHIELDKNQLDEIPEYIATFSNLKRLTISLNINPLFLNTEVLGAFSKLSFLSFSGTRIQNWPVKLPSLLLLRTLILSGCGIKFLSSKSFEYPQLDHLDLSDNFLVSLPPDTFVGVPQIKKLKLNNNRLSVIWDGTFISLHSIDFVYMGNNNLKIWPIFPPRSIEVVNLTNNKLASLVNMGRYGTRIFHLDVSGNYINKWYDEDIFLVTRDDQGHKAQDNETNSILSINYNTPHNNDMIPWVNTLNISRNNINFFSDKMLKSLDCLEVVDLGANKIDCGNCETIRLQMWLGNRETTVFDLGENKSLTCLLPDTLKGKSVYKIKFDLLCSISKRKFWWDVGTLVVVLASIVVILSGIAFYYRTELVYLKHLAMVRKNSKLSDQDPGDSIYDAFVCYSGKNRKWVLRRLGPLLEGPPERYRLCFFDRDFRLGTHIVANIVDAIDQSRKVVLVVSEKFVASKWCKWELEMANHKMFSEDREFLVLLELQPLERRHLPRLLRFLLDTRPVVRWPRPETEPRVLTAAAALRKALGPSLSQRAREPRAAVAEGSLPKGGRRPFAFADSESEFELSNSVERQNVLDTEPSCDRPMVNERTPLLRRK